jgi:hypothetical protein
MTKDELEIKISTLQNLVVQKNDELTDYAAQIQRLSDELKDLNKPKLTPLQFDELRDAIEEAVGHFDFEDADNYSFDFHIDYDNRVAIESLTFDNADEIVREVYDQVSELFAEAECPDEDNNQENQD